MFNHKIQGLEVLEQTFEPRYLIELTKAGEAAGGDYFSRGFASGTRGARGGRLATLRHGWRYTVECAYCSRRFKRMRRDTALKPHQDGYGNKCFGQRGMIVDQELV